MITICNICKFSYIVFKGVEFLVHLLSNIFEYLILSDSITFISLTYRNADSIVKFELSLVKINGFLYDKVISNSPK